MKDFYERLHAECGVQAPETNDQDDAWQLTPEMRKLLEMSGK